LTPKGAAPDAAMMAAPEALARFLETTDPRALEGVFSTGETTILENFPPHVFAGRAGLAQWRELMTRHVGAIADLRHAFGPPQDFGRTDDTAYFTLPTRWTGVRDGKSFDEDGGWSFVLLLEAGAWRVRAYAWSVVRFEG
jgi:hypothetical protein